MFIFSHRHIIRFFAKKIILGKRRYLGVALLLNEDLKTSIHGKVLMLNYPLSIHLEK